jgi:hypothetical protein
MSRQESSPRVGQVIDLPRIGNLLHVGVTCPWTLGLCAAIFVAKIFWESTTGRMFFGTESLGDIGVPIALAHVAGTAAAILLSIRLPSAVHCQLGARTSSRSIPWIKPHRIRPR